MGFVYFALIYKWLSDRIDTFGMNLMATFMTWASAVALVLVTLWIMIQGYRMITGQSRESMMALVMSMTRVAIIVTVATTMSIFGTNLLSFFTTELSTGINQMFTGDNSTAAQTIDENLAWTQLALGAIDTVQVAPGDTETINQKNHALLIAGLGTASPPMAAAAMLLLYKFALALFIGLGPLFILCLIFEQTKSLFQRWLLYGIGTVFSMAVLAFVSSLVLQLSLRVAAALWSANIINTITGQGAEGFSTQALEQGGLGLLLTVLIISVPPMAVSAAPSHRVQAQLTPSSISRSGEARNDIDFVPMATDRVVAFDGRRCPWRGRLSARFPTLRGGTQSAGSSRLQTNPELRIPTASAASAAAPLDSPLGSHCPGFGKRNLWNSRLHG